MGPPFENGGGHPRDWGAPCRDPASMGPPFENGGGGIIDRRESAWALASMGPPFENGGGACGLADRYERDPGRRFNGAAVRKRRRATHACGEEVGSAASMGPPFENGGGGRTA